MKKLTSFIALLVLMVAFSVITTTKAGAANNVGPPTVITANAAPASNMVSLTVTQAAATATNHEALNIAEASNLNAAEVETTGDQTATTASLKGIVKSTNRAGAGDLPAPSTSLTMVAERMKRTNGNLIGC